MTAGHWRVIRASTLVAVLVAAATLLTGCRTSGLVFAKSQFHITSPGTSSTTTLPLKISWNAGSLARPGDRFAVFLDRETIQPGQNVLRLIPDSCKQIPTCSREQFLEQEKVWLTAQPSLVLEVLPSTIPADHRGGKEYHSLTVIILDSSLRRTGEEFATTDFVYHRPA